MVNVAGGCIMSAFVATYDLSEPGLLFRDDVIDDPAPLYAQLRREAPVWEVPGSRSFLVTTHALVEEALARPEDFSSNLTSLVYRDTDGSAAVFDMSPMGDAIHVLATADPPTHTRHRKLLQPSFAPGRMAALEPTVRAAVDELMAALLREGSGDYMRAVADLLPMRVICTLIGLDPAEAPRLVQLVLDVDQILAGVSDAEGMARAAASAGEQGALLGVALQRTMQTGGDPETSLGVLAAAVDAGDATFEEAVGMLVQLLAAGTETTTSLIGRAAMALAEDHALQQRLRDDVAAVPAFLEEVLRRDGPFRFHYRSVPRDTELGGVAVPAGSRLLLMWAAANLDDAVHERPHEIDLARSLLRNHLAFGRGMHFCIGAPLARLEARVAIERLLTTTTEFDLDPACPPRFHRDIFLRRLAQLGLRVR
jgi:cytochrome P450